MTATTLETTETTKLTGAELLTLVKDMGDASKSDLVRAAGYLSIKKDGSERLNFTAFYEALLEAKGIDLGAPVKVGDGRRGRAPSYATTVQFNGNLMVGNVYTRQLGLKPGDQFQIKLGKNGNISLIPARQPEEVAEQHSEPAAV